MRLDLFDKLKHESSTIILAFGHAAFKFWSYSDAYWRIYNFWRRKFRLSKFFPPFWWLLEALL